MPEDDPERRFRLPTRLRTSARPDTLQELLEMRAESERRSRLAEQLQGVAAATGADCHMREKTAGNGHGLN